MMILKDAENEREQQERGGGGAAAAGRSTEWPQWNLQ